MAGKPIVVLGATVVERNVALPGRVIQRSVNLSATGGIAVAGGVVSPGVEIDSAHPWRPTPLSPEAIIYLAQALSAYVAMRLDSPEAGLLVAAALFALYLR